MTEPLPLDLIMLVLGVILALLAVLIVVRLVRGGRRKVNIAPPTLDATPPAPTLVRKVAMPNVPVSPTVTRDSQLTQLKGVGPKLAAVLAEKGVTQIEQIAAWSDEDLARIDAELGSFSGRATRDQWVEQARLLSGGDRAMYEAKFGRLDGPAA